MIVFEEVRQHLDSLRGTHTIGTGLVLEMIMLLVRGATAGLDAESMQRQRTLDVLLECRTVIDLVLDRVGERG